MLGGVHAQSTCVDVTVESLSSVLSPVYIWSQLWVDGSRCQDLHRDVIEKEMRGKIARLSSMAEEAAM